MFKDDATTLQLLFNTYNSFYFLTSARILVNLSPFSTLFFCSFNYVYSLISLDRLFLLNSSVNSSLMIGFSRSTVLHTHTPSVSSFFCFISPKIFTFLINGNQSLSVFCFLLFPHSITPSFFLSFYRITNNSVWKIEQSVKQCNCIESYIPVFPLPANWQANFVVAAVGLFHALVRALVLVLVLLLCCITLCSDLHSLLPFPNWATATNNHFVYLLLVISLMLLDYHRSSASISELFLLLFLLSPIHSLNPCSTSTLSFSLVLLIPLQNAILVASILCKHSA